MATMTEEPDLYEKENQAGKKNPAADYSTEKANDEFDSMMAADKQRGSDNAELAGIKAATERAEKGGGKRRFSRTQARAVFGGAAFGVVGLITSIIILVAPAFGISDLTENISDFSLGSNNDIRGRRQARLFSDLIRDGADGVYEGKRVGAYQTRLGRAWNDFQFGRFVAKARAAGYVIDFDPLLVNGSGNPINEDSRGRFKERVPTRIETPDGRVVQLAEVRDLNGLDRVRLRGRADINQVALNGVINSMTDDVYPQTVVKAAQRFYYKPFLRSNTGFRWGKFFSQTATDTAAGRSLKRIVGADSKVYSAPDGTLVDIDGNPVEIPELDVEVSEELDEATRKLVEGDGPISTRVKSAVAGVKTKLSTGIRRGSIFLGIASLGCLAQQLFQADVEGQFVRWTSLMNYGAMLSSLGEELLLGGYIDLEEVGDLVHEFISRNDIRVDDFGNVFNKVLTAADSADLQRALGAASIVGEELSAENYLSYPGDGLTRVGDALASFGPFVGKIPFSSSICGALNSWFGTFVDLIFGIGECLLAPGVGCVASETFFLIWGDELIARLVGFGASGQLGIIPIWPAQYAANFAQAKTWENSLHNNTGTPITNDQYNDQVITYMEERQEDIRDLPFSERYFAMSTPNSLIQQISLWRSQFFSESTVNKFATILKLPFTAIGKLFSLPIQASNHTHCVSENHPKTIESARACVEPDNFYTQQYTHDVTIDYCGPLVNLLSGEVVGGVEPQQSTYSDGYEPTYGSEWVEYTVLSIISYDQDLDDDGDGDPTTFEISDPEDDERTIQVEDSCLRSDANARFVRDVMTRCWGVVLPEPVDGEPQEVFVDPTRKASPYNDPAQHGANGAQDLNDDYVEWCEESGREGRSLHALAGRYVDDLILQSAMIALSNPDANIGSNLPDLGAIPDDNIEALANTILNHPNIEFEGGASGPVAQEFRELAERGSVELLADVGSSEVEVDRDLLAMMVNLLQTYNSTTFRIGALVNGHGIPVDAEHSNGKAILITNEDIAPDVLPYLYENAGAFFINKLIFDPMPDDIATLLDGEDHVYATSTLNSFMDQFLITVD